MAALQTPYYLIDEGRLRGNMEKVRYVRERSGAKSVLALKCFSAWCVFDLMRPYMDGTTSSSLYEARLGCETFGKEVHAYSVAFTAAEVRELAGYAHKVIFNSASQLRAYAPLIEAGEREVSIGLRVNPGFSYSDFDLADPARPHSRLGVVDRGELERCMGRMDGLMFHYNCENGDFANFHTLLGRLGDDYGEILKELRWVSLGGGIYFTREGYPLDAFCRALRAFADTYGVQVYLEPGEAAVTESAWLLTRVLDIVANDGDIAIVDASIEAHMLDLLVYRERARVETAREAGMELEEGRQGEHEYTIAGRSCLAGDIFGKAAFARPLRPGDVLAIADAAGYTMVKKNWFNGLPMPSIVVRRLDGRLDTIRSFDYQDFKSSMA